MRPYAWLFPVAIYLLAPASAVAQQAVAQQAGQPTEPEPDDAPQDTASDARQDLGSDALADDSAFIDRLVLDTGRFSAPEARETSTNFSVHGEYQLRFRAYSDLPLQQPIGAAPGVSEDLGSNYHLYHWLRIKPVFQYQKAFKVVGEIDIPRGMIVGDTTDQVGAATDPLDEERWYDVFPRQLYMQYLTPIGLLRIGHQTSHWGMGILANDGDHPTLFGDVKRGAIVERLLFATRPGGADHPLAVALGGDFVFEDSRADALDNEDRALQAIAAVRWDTPGFELGVYGVFRHQERDAESVDALTPFTEELTVGVADIAGKFNYPIAGNDAYLFGEFEFAFIAGTTNFVRNIVLTREGEEEEIRSFGGAGRLGIVKEGFCSDERYGELVVTMEYGYASGDADPYDGVTKRFTFVEQHNVGLVLFDHVLAWKTARAATVAGDPGVVARPAPGLDFLPSQGGVFGASYFNPTFVVRPRHWLDLKGGVVIAQATADFVDPFHAGALGDYANYDGGDERNTDLGVELDAGADARIPISDWVKLQLGIEGGLLFPGGAFDDAVGNKLPKQYLLNSKVGLQF
jgi:hypothetical protein